ncbi:hypothetical protein M378DRAFT_18447 [Amanita muscaria Koide BX008]|uniref:Uncharacterized protein n=1 Tax=Amanita muscaria (strain Koide BX008) TaxID=946122 RepID=A0A0C2WE81_AMAMK|nr:hypothetical protein M378DRAFT_18447 [Amanita muscaria Koide BX008]
MRKKRHRSVPGTVTTTRTRLAPLWEQHSALSAPPIPQLKAILLQVSGFMIEFATLLRRHTKYHHHHQVLAWRMTRLTEDLNKILAYTLRESPSCITAFYASAKPIHRGQQHPRRPRDLVHHALWSDQDPDARHSTQYWPPALEMAIPHMEAHAWETAPYRPPAQPPQNLHHDIS